MTCNHPISKLTIYSASLIHLDQQVCQEASIKILLQCKCGQKHSLESEITK